MAEGFERMDGEDDPQRCQCNTPQGQCTNKGINVDGEYGKFCLAHGGNKFRENKEKAKIRNYNLTKWQAKMIEKSDSSVLKNLNEEIGILRVILEGKLNACNDMPELILSSSIISDLVMKIEKLVTSLNKLEKNMGMHLDKAAILQFASETIEVIGRELEGNSDTEAINRIGEGILRIVGRIGGSD